LYSVTEKVKSIYISSQGQILKTITCLLLGEYEELFKTVCLIESQVE